jgi:hyaluronoglucosaminidase
MSFATGVIEGFYGRQWHWEQRLAVPERLKHWGYDAYIYAPKGDASLRSAWQHSFTVSHRQHLLKLSQSCHQSGIHFGVGLSPVGLQAAYTPQDRQLLKAKVAAIVELGADILWVLFDDLPAGNLSLADNQLAVVNDIRQWQPALKLAVCPSYYSFDPVLETLFGVCPENYFADLSEGLDQDIDLLWTGNRVVSDSYAAEDIAKATRLLGRKPLLWDNYPVNDGRKISRFLHLAPFVGRPWQLSQWCSGHIVNPMNQYHLSGLVLPTLAELYRCKGAYNSNQAFRAVLANLPTRLAELLLRDAGSFQNKGLDGINDETKQELLAEYASVSHPVAVEICDWLEDKYRFDPACLTD